MPSIQKRNGSYRVRVKRVGETTLSKTFTNRTDALKWAKFTEAQLTLSLHEDEKNPSGEAILFKDAAESYIKNHSVHKKIVRSETYRLKILMKRWEGLTVAQVDKKAVLALRDELIIARRSNDTINHYFNTLSKLFQMLAGEWDLDIANPIKGIKRMPPPQGRSKRVNNVIEDPLLSACDALSYPLLKSMIEFAIQTAMRRGEIMGLTWSDVDLDERKAYLHTSKNGEPRQVPLTQRALEVLKALIKDETGRVFPMTVHDLRGQFNRAKAHAKEAWIEAGINPFDDLRFHDLRHEALSRLSDLGLNVIELSCISGHKTLGMLKRYTHPSHEAIIKKIDS
jgi:integrase